MERLMKLKRATHRNKAHGKAPHKPVLLLAVIEQIEVGNITDNQIFITAELVATFQKIWLKLVPHEGWQPRFFLPFYHLTGDNFWHLNIEDGSKVALTNSYSPKSIAALKDSIAFAYLDDWLWQIMSVPEERRQIKSLILQTYFAKRKYQQAEIRRETTDYVKQLELEFLGNRDAAESIAPAYRLLAYEARSTVFKNFVPKIYDYTCAISQQKITTSTGIQMIDACHIEPWSVSKNDTIQNGITLTPTLHRAFDRHLISIDEDYRIVVSPNLKEDSASPFNIRQFEGKELLLPAKREWWPQRESIAKHRAQLL